MKRREIRAGSSAYGGMHVPRIGSSGVIPNKFRMNILRNEIEQIPGRLDFWKETKKNISIRASQAKCHSFSQHFIANILELIVNYAIAYPNARDGIGQMLVVMGFMVFGEELSEERFEYGIKTAEFTEQCALAAANDQEKTEKSGRILNLANEMMHMLNNSPYNLRPGDGRWNSSIRNDFDPTAWACVWKVGGVMQYVDQGGLDWRPDTQRRPAGICLTDDEDVKRLLRYRELNGMLESEYPFGIDVYQMANGYIVGSSSNRFQKPSGCAPGKCSQIYVQNNGRWESVL